MNNHIIVGQDRMCLCGVYNQMPVSCAQVIEALTKVKAYAASIDKPISSPLVAPVALPTAHDINLICNVLEPLIKDCE